MTAVAALYVDARGPYVGLDGVDVWDVSRDARRYPGDAPVVAHPPCQRWCRLAGLVEKQFGYPRGVDDGEFAAALRAVRTYGGVLEHPAYSDAWAAFELNRPPTGGGWVNADWEGGWTCYVEQGRYGHPAKKATWLYAVGVDLPSLRWGFVPHSDSDVGVSWCGNTTRFLAYRDRVGKRAASMTPVPFRDVLLDMARSVRSVR